LTLVLLPFSDMCRAHIFSSPQFYTCISVWFFVVLSPSLRHCLVIVFSAALRHVQGSQISSPQFDASVAVQALFFVSPGLCYCFVTICFCRYQTCAGLSNFIPTVDASVAVGALLFLSPGLLFCFVIVSASMGVCVHVCVAAFNHMRSSCRCHHSVLPTVAALCLYGTTD